MSGSRQSASSCAATSTSGRAARAVAAGVGAPRALNAATTQHNLKKQRCRESGGR